MAAFPNIPSQENTKNSFITKKSKGSMENNYTMYGILYNSSETEELRKKILCLRYSKTEELLVENLWKTPIDIQKLKNCSSETEVDFEQK